MLHKTELKGSRLASKRANITLLTAALSVLLMGIVALVTDVGSLYYTHAKLQTATNAAWKAGYDKLSEIRKTKSRLTEEDEQLIKHHMIEVMAANGFSDLSEEQLTILLTQNQTNLQIDANDDAKLFFMKLFNVQKATVAASREGGVDSYSIMPVAVPHGEVHDLSVRTYDYIPFEGSDGFASGTEYILKLGGDENADPLGKSQYMIYIPTGLQGSQRSDANTLLAYGAAFWALQIDETDNEAMVPAYWLLSNSGGGFLLKDGAKLRQRLEEYGLKQDNDGYRLLDAEAIALLLRYVEVNIDKTEVNSYLTGLTKGVNTNELIVPLEKRPQIAIYSSQTTLDPVEQILVAAKIPYGTYALPKTSSNLNGWGRNEDYDQNRNTKIFDLEILNGELSKYDWIHLHHEDFTGLTINDGSNYCGGTFPTDCKKKKYKTEYNYGNCCYNKFKADKWYYWDYTYGNGDWIKETKFNINVEPYKSWHNKNVNDASNKFKAKLCTYCKGKAVLDVGSFGNNPEGKNPATMIHYKSNMTGTKYQNGENLGVRVKSWTESESVMKNNCKNTTSTTTYDGRCGSCGSCSGTLNDQKNFSGCLFYKFLNKKYGYSDDDYNNENHYVFTSNDIDENKVSRDELFYKWFSSATAYQKMKWDVAQKIKQHILDGGFMYTQCFAAETFDLALSQRAYYYDKNNSNKSSRRQNCYNNCLAFTDFTYKKVPKKGGYSSIYSGSYGEGTIQSLTSYSLEYKYSPFCQVIKKPNSGPGATCSFNDNKIKPGIDKMSSLNSYNSVWQYIGGWLTDAQGEQKGHFSLMGGHNAQNIDASRLVLNNVMLGSLSNKETSVGTHYVGRTKYQYGCVDLDNDGERSSADYSKYMLYGFDSPVNFADIVSTDNNIYSAESKENMKIITGQELATYTPNTIVIVPIVGVPGDVQGYQKYLANNANGSADLEIEEGDYTIYDLKVGEHNYGAAGYDDLESKYSPKDIYMAGLKNSVQVIGFAKFQLKSEADYNRSDILGDPLEGQIRGDFLGYIVDPRDTQNLLKELNGEN